MVLSVPFLYKTHGRNLANQHTNCCHVTRYFFFCQTLNLEHTNVLIYSQLSMLFHLTILLKKFHISPYFFCPNYSTMRGRKRAVGSASLRGLLLSLLSNQRLVDVRNYACREREQRMRRHIRDNTKI